jgi:uncharacterized cofD-like protein
MARAAAAERRMSLVGIGGGTGLSVLLDGLRRYARRGQRRDRQAIELAAIVSVADDGGSTGQLRQSLDIPAVGDLRNCLVAVSGGDRLWRELFQHRFAESETLGGHPLGNLVVAALTQRSGGLLPAVELLARPLRLCGRVLPVTEEKVTLHAELADGQIVHGESQLPASRGRIVKTWLVPEHAAPARGVLETIAQADAVFLGPGSLYTSLLPNLLVDGVAEALRRTRALRVLVCNLMTQRGETDGFDALDHLRALERHLGRGAIDVCLLNGAAPSPEALARYARAGCEPVAWSRRGFAESGTLPIVADLLPDGGFVNRHDPAKLARAAVSIARCLRPRRAAAMEEDAAAAADAAAFPPSPWLPRRETSLQMEAK